MIDKTREIALKILYKIDKEQAYSNIVLNEEIKQNKQKINEEIDNLNKEEKSGLADLIKTKASKKIIDKYVIKLVYGVKKFDNYGSY